MAPSFRQVDPRSSRKAQTPNNLARRLLIDVGAKEDNEARAAWRRRDPVPDVDAAERSDERVLLKTVFRFDRNFEPVRDILRSKPDLKEPGLFPDIEEIATDTSTCIVFLPLDHRTPAVEILGTQVHIDEAKARLRQWVREIDPNTRAGRLWAKIPSLNDEQKAKEARKIKKAYEKEQFRRDPDPQKSWQADARAYFEWPKEEADPREVFGPRLEALDRIRTQCQCHITYNSDQALFEVIGNKQHTKDGVRRLRATYYQVLAKRFAAETLYLVQPLPKNIEHAIVELAPYRYDTNISGMVAKISGAREVIEEDEGCTAQCEGGMMILKKAIYKSLQKTVATLPYYRGHISMKATLGTFILTKYKPPKEKEEYHYSLDEFVEMVGHSNFRGTISHGLSQNQTKEPLGRILDESPMFTNAAPSNLLPDIGPACTTTLTVRHNEYLFRLEFDHDPDITNQKPSATRFSILEENVTGFDDITDLYLVNVDTSSAWHIHTKASRVFKLSQFPILKRFTERVKMKNGVLVHESHTMLHIESRETKKTQRYAIAKITGGVDGSPYICELSTIEHCLNENKAGQPARYKLLKSFDTLSVFIDDWNVNFAKNARLKLGQGVDWKADMPLWFPEGMDNKDKRVDGMTKLLGVLKDVERVVFAKTAETSRPGDSGNDCP